MKTIISVSAAKKLLSIESIKAGLTPSEWKTFEKWLQQEAVKPDSSDFWKKGGAKEDALVDKVLGMFPKSSRVWKSPEPFRATIDDCVEMYKFSETAQRRVSAPASNSKHAKGRIIVVS